MFQKSRNSASSISSPVCRRMVWLKASRYAGSECASVPSKSKMKQLKDMALGCWTILNQIAYTAGGSLWSAATCRRYGSLSEQREFQGTTIAVTGHRTPYWPRLLYQLD